MIDRNIGNAERITRFVLGLVFGGWALSQPALNGGEWAVVAVSIALLLNGIFSRCYLWYLLDVNTDNDHGSASSMRTC